MYLFPLLSWQGYLAMSLLTSLYLLSLLSCPAAEWRRGVEVENVREDDVVREDVDAARVEQTTLIGPIPVLTSALGQGEYEMPVAKPLL